MVMGFVGVEVIILLLRVCNFFSVKFKSWYREWLFGMRIFFFFGFGLWELC